MRTEIHELQAELAAVAERQRKMHLQLRHLDVRSLQASIQRLTTAIDANASVGAVPGVSQSHRPMQARPTHAGKRVSRGDADGASRPPTA